MAVTHFDNAHTSPTVSFGWLRRLYDSVIAARQKQADRRTAIYLGGLPDQVRQRLGVSDSMIAKLRDPAN